MIEVMGRAVEIINPIVDKLKALKMDEDIILTQAEVFLLLEDLDDLVFRLSVKISDINYWG